VIPAPFAYQAARSIDEAAAPLAEHGEDARPLAGGQSLLPMLKLRFVRPELLVDLGRVGPMRQVAPHEGG
jgi:aerobic carbon-monoxide dehydrogenase medium subunit